MSQGSPNPLQSRNLLVFVVEKLCSCFECLVDLLVEGEENAFRQGGFSFFVCEPCPPLNVLIELFGVLVALFVVVDGVVECQSFVGVHDCCWLKRHNVVCFWICLCCLFEGW